MPIIAAALLILAAIIYGATMLYLTVTAEFGRFSGVAAVVSAALVMALFISMGLRRYRAIHGVTIKGKRTLKLKGTWGEIRIDANQKSGKLDLEGKTVLFIFADIADARAVANEKTWQLELLLNNNNQALWSIPMSGGKEARRWTKILKLAAAQEL
ncbi:hypothetical protein L1889_12750 [Paenalcaligenes niemegkensis]|uniref:hypothetical protein n=1 Tax=Paenalcaligenes niemegkensis TaxID=2895469 RepID=UPI001EE7CA90|nr:hypothetical protein [Paenalcaligenes niemegkensis]MCQ9617451.1 hypothetical protein [Paenalcaligenes niemegkensis]